MRTALVTVGNGREYVFDAVPAALAMLPDLDYLLMVDDSGNPEWAQRLDDQFPDFTITHHPGNRGMAAAVQSGFDLVLDTNATHVFWVEDDMLLVAEPPIAAAADALAKQSNLAQMCFRREPWWGSPAEMECGDQLAAICQQAAIFKEHDDYTTHDYLFSLNPCLIPREVLQFGWPSGPLGIGNESGMTTRLLAEGYVFGSWGHPGDGSVWARHIGEQRGAGWQL